MKKAIFIDKDGTLVANVPYNVEPRRVTLNTGAERALGQLQAAGFVLVVVSNQPGIALGYFNHRALATMMRHVRQILKEHSVHLSGFYYCPHSPQAACACRKPAPGLIQAAARHHNIDLRRSWFIGDILDDIEAGRRAGCHTVLLDNGNETEWRDAPLRRPHFCAADLSEAAAHIIGNATTVAATHGAMHV